jgi:hypothetical protein
LNHHRIINDFWRDKRTLRGQVAVVLVDGENDKTEPR